MILSINVFDNWLLLSHNYKSVPHIIKIPILLFYLYWPATYFWVKIQNLNFKFKYLDLIHLIPFIYVFLTSYSFYFKSGDLKLKELYSSTTPPNKIFILLTYIMIIFYLVISYKVIKKENQNYKATLTLFIFNILYIILLITSYLLRYLNISYSVNIYYMRFVIPIILFLSILIILVIDFKKMIEKDDSNLDNLADKSVSNNLENSLNNLENNLKNGESLENSKSKSDDNLNSKKENREKKNQKYQRSRLTEEDSKKYLKKLIDFMEDGEPYRDIDLNLKKISEKLDISNAYISQVLNEYLGENFYTFINRYRIELAKKMLEDSKKDYLTILAIAYDSGFKSKGTFNQSFKRITKTTPSAYRKQFSKE